MRKRDRAVRPCPRAAHFDGPACCRRGAVHTHDEIRIEHRDKRFDIALAQRGENTFGGSGGGNSSGVDNG